MDCNTTNYSSQRLDATWFGHPRALTILFLTETWEKFSFFGMRALLVYYMTKELLIPQSRASYIYGMYTAFVYFTPIVGGIVSDRWLGRRRSILAGGTIMAAGHFMMVSPNLFYPALATIVIGNGLFLPSVPSQIGALYRPEDPRRASAYNIYYVGVNLGGFLAPFVCGTLGEIWGWHWGFAAAGIGMLMGLLIYVMGARYLPEEARTQPLEMKQGSRAEASDSLWRCFSLLAAIAVVVVVFRGAYEQIGNTIALWADDGVDRAVGERFIPMTWFQSLGPLLVFALTPLLVARWTRLAREGRDASPIVKMSRGAIIVGASYLMIAAVTYWCEAHGAKASWLWLATFCLVMTVGELHILPIGLGLFGRLAPLRFAATTIAVWFLAAFGGNLFAGSLGSLWSRIDHAAFFAVIAAVAGSAGLALRAFDKPVRRAEEIQRLQISAVQGSDSRDLSVPIPARSHAPS